MALKTHVLALLHSNEASRIRFAVPASTGTVTIDRTTFKTVTTAIVAGKIRIKTQTTFAPGVGAEYGPSAVPASGGLPAAPSGELRIPPILGRSQEGLLLHECAHAFFDLTRSRIAATEEEAVCYVVNALYFRMTGLSSTRWTNEPHRTAKAVADGLLHRYAAGVWGVPAVDTSTWRGLVLAVALNPTYFLNTAGLPRWFHGTNGYSHDG